LLYDATLKYSFGENYLIYLDRQQAEAHYVKKYSVWNFKLYRKIRIRFLVGGGGGEKEFRLG